jgi:hypothetical protein
LRNSGREGFLKGSRNKKISRPKNISRTRNQEEKCEFRKYKYIRIKPRKKERKRRSLCCILPLSRNKREEKSAVTVVTTIYYHSTKVPLDNSPLPSSLFFLGCTYSPPASSLAFSPKNQNLLLCGFSFSSKKAD